jgi:hypothetical protein
MACLLARSPHAACPSTSYASMPGLLFCTAKLLPAVTRLANASMAGFHLISLSPQGLPHWQTHSLIARPASSRLLQIHCLREGQRGASASRSGLPGPARRCPLIAPPPFITRVACPRVEICYCASAPAPLTRRPLLEHSTELARQLRGSITM